MLIEREEANGLGLNERFDELLWLLWVWLWWRRDSRRFERE